MSAPGLSQWVDWARRGLLDPDLLRPEQVHAWLGPPEPLPAHVGLFLDRCLVEPDVGEGKEHPGRQALYKAAVAALRPGTPAVKNYEEVFAQHRARVGTPPPGVLRRSVELTARSRLLLHPETAGTVTESALLLHHTYGVPYLPGSALKGLCRAWLSARGRGQPGMPDLGDLFGDEPGRGVTDDRRAGLFDFWDALWIPDFTAPGFESALQLDVVNPHHPDYYTASGHPAPAFSDDPVPTHFLTVRPGARFLLVIDAPDSEGGVMERWLAWVVAGLGDALEEVGIGARTSAGYGRLSGAASARPASEKKGAVPGKQAARALAVMAGPEQVEGLGLLTRNKGDGSLLAVMVADRSEARARGAEAAVLHGKLSEETRRRLERGKEVRVRVVVEVEGRMRRIVAIPEG